MNDAWLRRALRFVFAGMAVFMGGLIGQLILGTLHHQLIWWCVALSLLGLVAQAVGFLTLWRGRSR